MCNTWGFLTECKLEKCFWGLWVLALLLKLWGVGYPRRSLVWALEEDGESQPPRPSWDIP